MIGNDIPRTTKLIHGAGKLIIILASAAVFLFAVQSARGLVRVLSGMGSFLSLASIVILGIVELTWVILVSERKLPKNPRGAAAVFVGYTGILATALFVLIAFPVVVLASTLEIPIMAVPTAFETVALPVSLGIGVACFLFSRRLKRPQPKETHR